MPFFHGTVEHAEKVAERTIVRAESSVQSIIHNLLTNIDSFFLPQTAAHVEKLVQSTLGEVDSTVQQRLQDVDLLAKSLMAELDGELKRLILLVSQLVFGFFVFAVALWCVAGRSSDAKPLGSRQKYGTLMMLVGTLTVWLRFITDTWFFAGAGMGLVGFLWGVYELELSQEAAPVEQVGRGTAIDSGSMEKTIKRIHVEKTEVR